MPLAVATPVRVQGKAGRPWVAALATTFDTANAEAQAAALLESGTIPSGGIPFCRKWTMAAEMCDNHTRRGAA